MQAREIQTTSGAPPSGPSLSERDLLMLRAFVRGAYPWQVVRTWEGMDPPSLTEAVLLYNRHALRISQLRRVWINRRIAQ